MASKTVQIEVEVEVNGNLYAATCTVKGPDWDPEAYDLGTVTVEDVLGADLETVRAWGPVIQALTQAAQDAALLGKHGLSFLARS